MILPEQVPELLRELSPYFTTIVESQLKDYGESANAGCWVSFRLPAPEDLEPFRGQDRTGRNARTGKRYTLMLIELTDQDEHMPPEPEAKPRKLSQIAGGLCHDAKFRAWCEAQYGEPCPDEAAAAQLIREVCGIESRAHLDVNEEAAKVFRELLADYDKAKDEPSRAA
jgi:hypothetical protein